MGPLHRLLVAVLLGAAYGAVTSLLNDLSSEYGDLGSTLAGTSGQSLLKVLSTMAGAGWAWAALAVAVGWYTGTRRWGAAAGGLALAVAATAYYSLDNLLRSEPILNTDIWIWAAAGLLLGPPLGAVGATIGRPAISGLLAGLTVPVGAAVQMAVLPQGLSGPQVDSEAIWARWIVWVAAAAAALLIVVRHRRVDAAAPPADRTAA